MHKPAIRLTLAVLVGLSAQLTACCTCKHPPPPPPPVADLDVRECRHPKLAEIERCLKPCAEAGPAQRACTSQCCGLVGDLAQATDAEKDLLRRCRPECRPGTP